MFVFADYFLRITIPMNYEKLGNYISCRLIRTVSATFDVNSQEYTFVQRLLRVVLRFVLMDLAGVQSRYGVAYK